MGFCRCVLVCGMGWWLLDVFPPRRASLAGAARDGGECDFGVTLVWSEPCILGSVDRREGDAWSQSWLRPSDFCDDQLPSLQGPPVTLNAIRGGNLRVLGCGLPPLSFGNFPHEWGKPGPVHPGCPHPSPLPLLTGVLGERGFDHS